MLSWLNILGLALDIIGVILVFFYASIQPDHYNDGSFGFKDESPDAEEKKIFRQKRKAKYKLMSGIALSFILAGFIFQFIANLLKSLNYYE